MDNHKIDKMFLQNRTTVFFHAHCDDESFLSAGLLNEISMMDRKCVVIYGAAASIEGEEKTTIRQQQAIESCSILGINDVIFLKYCEPKYQGFPLMNQKVEDVTSELLRVLKENNINLPISLVSYDKNGGYGNKDHKIIYLVGREIKNKYQNSVYLSEVTLNRDKISEWIKDTKERSKPELSPQLEHWSKDFGLPDREIQFKYKLNSDQLKLKRRALAVHSFYNKPDSFPLGLNELDFDVVFGTEYLHIPWNLN